MQKRIGFKSVFVVLLQWLGALVGFAVSLTVANLLVPLPKNILDATPPIGIMSTGGAMLVNAAVNAAIVIWAARRSSFRGFVLWMQLLVLSFGAQAFETQIETGYFLFAFPLLQHTFGVYTLILRGLLTSLLFTLLAVLLVGGFRRRPRPATRFTVRAGHALRHGAWLAAVYVVLYMLFGYYVAWQSQQVRLFYGGPAALNSIFDQWGKTLMDKPELPVFQYFRGVLWILCLVPLFLGFSGRRWELVLLSALALAYLPTVELMFPNPLMPAGVSLAHFWEVSISTGVFGALCAWFIPTEVEPASGPVAAPQPGPA